MKEVLSEELKIELTEELTEELKVKSIEKRNLSMSSLNPQILHVVLFKWNEEASPHAIQAALEALRGLKNKVPGVLEITCGPNFSDRSKGWTHGLVVRFADREALEGYIPHPDHQAVVHEHISPIRADILVMDYEI